MIVITGIEQGSDEWHGLRLGIPTASCFDKIVTPTGKGSASYTGYLAELIAEWYMGESKAFFKSAAMERGNQLEPEARSLYKLITDNEPEEVTLVYKDDRKLVACSPDSLMPDKGLEIKCPEPHTHMEYFLSGGLPKKYLQQVQGSMWATGLNEWDFMSYHPELPPHIVTIKRDDEFIDLLDKEINIFIKKMLEARERLLEQKLLVNG